MKEVILNNFYGGIADSINENSEFKFDYSRHFDIYSDPKKLTPFTTILANNSGITADTNRIGNFIQYGSYTYAVGRKGATTDEKVKLFQNSGVSGAWEASTTGEATNTGVTNSIVLFEFKGLIIGMRSNRYIWTYAPATSTFTESAKDCGNSEIPYTNGLVGKANGYAYVATTNKLWQSVDGATWTQANLTIPTNEVIYGLQNYGIYLAVLTRNSTDSSSSKSYVYFWDFSSLYASEILELPDNGYTVLGVSGNTLIAVGNRTSPIGSELNAVAYSGGGYEPVFSRIYPSTVSLVKGVSRSRDGKMYFAVNDTTTGRPYQGIWSIGRNKTGYPMSVSVPYDYLENSGTAANIVNFLLVYSTTGTGYGVFICTDDYLIHKIGNSPSATASSYATVSPVSTFVTSKYYTEQEARLVATSLKYDSLPTAGVATLYYRANDSTTWVQICTDTTDSSTGHIATNIESTGADFPMFKNIQFKIESLGGAVITDFRFKYEEVGTIYG